MKGKQPRYVSPDGEMICSRCHILKPSSDFNKRRRSRTGYMSECRDCERIRRSEYEKKRIRHLPAQTGSKCCKSCGETKDITSFHGNSRCADGRSIYCKACTSETAKAFHAKCQAAGKTYDYHLRTTVGITLEDRQRMKDEQGGVCAICKGSSGRHGLSEDGLVVDHNHRTGKVRGLLCHKCNIALGHVDDSAGRLEAMMSYLLKYAD